MRALVAPAHDAVDAVLHAAEPLAAAVEAIAARLREGGTLHYVGAGTSGRLGILDAAECPPTFGVPPALVRGHIAGGPAALVQPVEGAEDDEAAGRHAFFDLVTARDAVVGISASGRARYVVGAVAAAREKGAFTVALVNVASSPLAAAAELAIAMPTGAEALAGSTRLKAGTAQKIALNALSTGVMVRLGRVYDNLMVDVVASNAKLRRRALGLVQRLAAVDETAARDLLERAGGRVKIAVTMARCGLDPEAARGLLDERGGSLRAAIGGVG